MGRRSDTLDRGHARFAERAWADAFDALAAADREAPLDPEDLEKLAWSAGLAGRDDELFAGLERLYEAHSATGRCEQAAQTAFWIGFRLISLGEPARAGGWFARAERAAERAGRDCAARGYLLLPAAHRAIATGDLDGAREALQRAAEIGERCKDVDLEVAARCFQAGVLLRQAETERGLAQLDEAMLAAARGELSPMMTGVVYCSAISNCHRVCAFDRAREWTDALSRWCDAQPQLETFTGSCLVHRAEILQLGGAWPEAEQQARHASERSANDPSTGAAALYQQAEVTRLRGDLDAAERLYKQASQLGREPHPGLALLRLAQGNTEAASTAILRVVAATDDPLERAKYLPAAVPILLASGRLEEARAASDELSTIAARFGTDVLGAMAERARGSVLLAAGDARGALAPLRKAFEVWQRVGAPYIAAQIRVELGRACRALGDEESGALEEDAAREVFERLGVSGVETAAEKRPGPAHGLTAREVEVLRLVASGKTNKSIAKELCLSEKTIDRHVSNIFAKVNVASRAAATAFAYENGLV